MSLSLAGFGSRLRQWGSIVLPFRRPPGFSSPPFQPSVLQRQRELEQFREHYETLVEAMCEAAQYGPTPKLEQEYARGRTWMDIGYPSVRPLVAAFLPERSVWAEPGGADDFAGLIAARSLEEFLRTDNGSMISRITRTREALTLYAEHLRLLAARNA